MYQVKITIVNDTTYHLYMPSEPNPDGTNPDFVMDPPGCLAPGSGLPLRYISPRNVTVFSDPEIPPSQCEFTVCTPATPISPATTTSAPSGSLRLILSAAKHEILLQWRDFLSQGKDKAVLFTSERLDDGFGELDVALTSELLGEGGKKMPNAQPRILNVTMTVRLIDRAPDPTLYERYRIIMPRVAVRPMGSAKTLVGKTYRRWNDPDLTAKRKMLLAYLGCVLPMCFKEHSIPLPPNSETFRARPDLKMATTAEPVSGMPWGNIRTIFWEGNDPKNKTTSCVSLNGNMESLLTGRTGYWAFEQYKLEEAWVPCGGHPIKKMPNVGDPYLIFWDGDKKNPVPHVTHCGFILHVPENETEQWITADGGQAPLGSSAFLNSKTWEWRIPLQAKEREKRRERPNEPDEVSPVVQDAWEHYVASNPFANPIEDTKYIYMAGGAESQKTDLTSAKRVLGWLDLDMISFKSLELPEPIPQGVSLKKASRKGLLFHQDMDWNENIHPTINDYWFLGAWIDACLEAANQPTTGSPTKVADWVAHFNSPSTKSPPAVPISGPPEPSV